MAILGIVLVIGFPLIQPPDARALANEINAAVQRGRFEAVKRDVPVAVRFDDAGGRITVRAPEAATVAAACGNDDVVELVVVEAAAYRQGAFSVVGTGVGGTNNSIVWLPNGRPVTCGGSPNVARTIIVSDARRSISLVVDVGGRIVRQ